MLVADRFDGAGVAAMMKALEAKGAKGMLVAPQLGDITADNGDVLAPEFSILTTASVLFDAVYVAGGEHATEWALEADAIDFVREAYKHCKAVAATGKGAELFKAAHIPSGGPDDSDPADAATIVAKEASKPVIKRFITAMAQHRLWSRELELHLPL